MPHGGNKPICTYHCIAAVCSIHNSQYTHNKTETMLCTVSDVCPTCLKIKSDITNKTKEKKPTLFTENFMEFFETILKQILLENFYYCAWQTFKYLAIHYSK